LWQNRFDSCAMEESHLWRAIRYVEMKPVRAGLVEAPERFRWSSAAAHCDGRDAFELLDMDLWQSSGGIARWGDLLQAATSESGTKRLRSAMYSSKPLGSEEFVRRARQAPKDKLEDGRAGGFSPTGSSFPGRATHMTSLSTQP
jgi:putative transposase